MDKPVKILSRSEFFQSTGLCRELVVLSSGGGVYVSELSAAQVVLYNERLKAMIGKGKKAVTPSASIELTALLISMTVCGEDGDLLFTEADAKRLTRTNLEDFMMLGTKALEVSKMNPTAAAEMKDLLKKTKKGASA